MCVIIDANRAGDIVQGAKPYILVLLKWIRGGGKIATGGHLEAELFKNGKMRDLLLQLSRSGQLRRYPSDRLAQIQATVSLKCKSDDPHVVALAIYSKAEIVVTEDADLILDLRDRSLVFSRRRIFKENAASPARVGHLTTLLARSDCP